MGCSTFAYMYTYTFPTKYGVLNTVPSANIYFHYMIRVRIISSNIIVRTVSLLMLYKLHVTEQACNACNI